jgi:hypothetical protein
MTAPFCGPVRGFTGRIAERQGDNAFGHFRAQQCGTAVSCRAINRQPPSASARHRSWTAGLRTLSAKSRTMWARKTCICAALRSAITARGRRRGGLWARRRNEIPCHAATSSGTPLWFKCQILSTGTMRALTQGGCVTPARRSATTPGANAWAGKNAGRLLGALASGSGIRARGRTPDISRNSGANK